MKTSDEIREWCNFPQAYSIPCDELRELADRIDREMVELPRDADGEPIHVGDTVFFPSSCLQMKVLSLSFDGQWHLTTNRAHIHDTSLIAHNIHDSWQYIADELEAAVKWCDQNGGYGTGISSVRESTLREWAERIRKLAKGASDGQDKACASRGAQRKRQRRHIRVMGRRERRRRVRGPQSMPIRHVRARDDGFPVRHGRPRSDELERAWRVVRGRYWRQG